MKAVTMLNAGSLACHMPTLTAVIRSILALAMTTGTRRTVITRDLVPEAAHLPVGPGMVIHVVEMHQAIGMTDGRPFLEIDVVRMGTKEVKVDVVIQSQ